jgi:hypothetical protein
MNLGVPTAVRVFLRTLLLTGLVVHAALAVEPDRPDHADALAQIRAFFTNVDANLDTGDFHSITQLKYANGYQEDANHYVVVASYLQTFKVSLSDWLDRDDQPNLGADISTGLMQLKYGQFDAGDSFDEVRSFLFMRTENGWILQQSVGDPTVGAKHVKRHATQSGATGASDEPAPEKVKPSPETSANTDTKADDLSPSADVDTGYPLVDAGMRELWATGYLSNRVRLVVASFLTKHLRIDWRQGEAWFWDTLLDADAANNAAGWQWVFGSGADAAPFFRIFNPVEQGRKFDPDGSYIRRWCPELARLPNQWIHAPFYAPGDILNAAGLVLGSDYPRPLVEHGHARQEALAAYSVTQRKPGPTGP